MHTHNDKHTLSHKHKLNTHIHRPPAADSLPHTSTAPPHRAYRIPPDSATGPALALHVALPRLRRPSTTAVFPRASSPRSTMGAPHHGCTPPTPFPALHAARPLSHSGHTQIDHATVPAHTHLSCVPPCVQRLSLLRGDSHYMGTQSGASPRPFLVSVVHTMNTMAGAMQFSRG